MVLKPTALVGLALIALAALPAGCSRVFIERAPPREEWPQSPFSLMPMKGCTESRTPEYLDVGAAVGIASIIPTIWVVQHFEQPPPSGESDVNSDFLFAVSAIMGALAALPFVISAVWGHHEIDRCRRYKAGPPYDDYDRGR